MRLHHPLRVVHQPFHGLLLHPHLELVEAYPAVGRKPVQQREQARQPLRRVEPAVDLAEELLREPAAAAPVDGLAEKFARASALPCGSELRSKGREVEHVGPEGAGAGEAAGAGAGVAGGGGEEEEEGRREEEVDRRLPWHFVFFYGGGGGGRGGRGGGGGGGGLRGGPGSLVVWAVERQVSAISWPL